MNANELRIGNIVSDFGGREARVSAITARGTMKLSSENYTDESFNFTERVIAPIPLTDDWLTRFGFECNESASDRYALFMFFDNWSNFQIFKENDDDVWFFDGRDDTEIQYVHQLQNLYFALTGEELELKQ